MKVGDLVRAKTTIYANGEHNSGGFGVVLAVGVKTPFRTGQLKVLWSDGVVLMADENYMEVISEKK